MQTNAVHPLPPEIEEPPAVRLGAGAPLADGSAPTDVGTNPPTDPPSTPSPTLPPDPTKH